MDGRRRCHLSPDKFNNSKTTGTTGRWCRRCVIMLVDFVIVAGLNSLCVYFYFTVRG
jgi:hypothetical protein